MQMPEPFISNFDACMSNPVHTNVTTKRYGPYTRNNNTIVWGNSALHPFKDMSDAPRSAPLGLRSLPSAEWFRKVVIEEFQRAQPVIMHCFASQYGGAGKRAGRNGFLPMLQSWLAHVDRVGRADHVLIVAQTADDCAMVRRYAPCVAHSDKLGYPAAMNEYAQNFRWIYSDLLLRGGVEHLSVDADAFFLADPLPHLAALDADLAGLSDKLYDGSGPLGYCDEPGDQCQSTGFTFLRPTQRVTQLVSRLADTFGGGFEQEFFNRDVAAELARDGRYALLPNSGDAAFANWNVVVPALREKKSISVVVLHLGGLQGGLNGASPDGQQYWMDSKEFLYRCAEVWLHIYP